VCIMKKLYARTENDFEDQTFKAARSSSLHLHLRLETLETSDAADWKSELRAALVAPPVYSNVSREHGAVASRSFSLALFRKKRNSRSRSNMARQLFREKGDQKKFLSPSVSTARTRSKINQEGLL